MAANLGDYQISDEAFHIVNAAHQILDNLEGVYQSYNVPLPSERFVTIGEAPTQDCEQAVVSYMQTYLGAPGDDAQVPQSCVGPLSMVVNITITRKQATNAKGIPSSAQKSNDADWAMVDAYVIMNNLKTLDPFGDTPNPSVIATANTIGPAGAYFTTSVQLTVMVP